MPRSDDGIVRSLLAAAAISLALWGLVVVRTAGASIGAPVEAVLDVVSGMMAGLAGMLLLARYRWTRDCPACWIGLGFVSLGASRLIFRLVVPLVDIDLATSALEWGLRFGGRAVALVALVVALSRPEFEARRQGRAFAVVAVAVVAAVGSLFAVGGVGSSLFVDDAVLTLQTVGHFVVAGLLALAWLALAAVYLRVGIRRGRPLIAWFGLSCALLGAAQLMTLPATIIDSLNVVSAAVLRSAGYACALAGVLSEARRLYITQADALRETSTTAANLAERVRRDRESYAAREHSARNALHVIDAAVHTLESHRDALRPEDRQRLETSVQSGITRLQQLLRTSEA